LREGKLPGKKFGRDWVLPLASVEAPSSRARPSPSTTAHGNVISIDDAPLATITNFPVENLTPSNAVPTVTPMPAATPTITLPRTEVGAVESAARRANA